MPLIDATYFTADRAIAGLSSVNVNARLQAFIEKHEPKFLRDLFGEGLYRAYQAGLATDPVPARWTALQSEALKEAIASYVYYWWLRDRETLTTGIGEVKPQAENSTPASSMGKQVQAWNEMTELVSDIYDALDGDAYTYPEWVGTYRWYYVDATGRRRRNPFAANNTLNI